MSLGQLLALVVCIAASAVVTFVVMFAHIRAAKGPSTKRDWPEEPAYPATHAGEEEWGNFSRPYGAGRDGRRRFVSGRAFGE